MLVYSVFLVLHAAVTMQNTLSPLFRTSLMTPPDAQPQAGPLHRQRETGVKGSEVNKDKGINESRSYLSIQWGYHWNPRDRCPRWSCVETFLSTLLIVNECQEKKKNQEEEEEDNERMDGWMDGWREGGKSRVE